MTVSKHRPLSLITRSKFPGIILMLLVLIFPEYSHGQTEALYSSYLFNPLSINPAYAGSKESLNLNIWGKRQWVGIEGAPSSVLLSAHTPLPNQRMAVGMNVFNESWGINRQSGISGIYAYRLPLGDKTYLSAGLQAGFVNLSANFTSLTMKSDNDPIFSQDETYLIPDFSGGLFLYSEKFFAGLSSSHLQGDAFTSSTPYNLIRRQIFLTSGIVFSLSDDLKLKPTVLIRGTEGSGIQGDINANLLIRDVLWTGLSYRSTGSLVFLTQMKLSQGLDFGYAIDVATSLSSRRNFVSHELMLNYHLAFLRSEITAPKYF